MTKQIDAPVMNVTKVFSSGIHKGRTYTNSDLQRTVEAYNSAKVTAPWTVGHEIAAGDPAAGWLRSLAYEEEDGVGFLVATTQFNALGHKILERKTHENKSISFYPPDSPNNPVPGTYFPRHVAMLGAEMPALKNLGTITDFPDTSFSEELITVFCPNNTYKKSPIDMEELLEIKTQLALLSSAVKNLTELIVEEVSEEAEPAVNENSTTECKACNAKTVTYSEESVEPDYKALYEASQKALNSQTEANAAVALAQKVELLYSEGVLTEAELPAKDLITCLTKLKLGATDYAETNTPELVIEALVKALQGKTTGIEIGQTLPEYNDSEPELHALDTSDSLLGDQFAEKMEEIAQSHNLSYSQAMTAHIAAEATAKAGRTSYANALRAEVKRYTY